MPSITLKAFQVPKDGHSAQECEDAFAADPVRGRFAVADGASEAFAAGTWARLLVQGFIRHEGPWGAWLAQARSLWLAPFTERPLSWFDETKLQEGACATLLGLELHHGGAWQAECVGDTSLFQVRDNRLLRAFPMLRSADFNNRPDLVCSQPHAGDNDVWPLCLVGDWRVGDVVYLATDALAQWFLSRHEQGLGPWRDWREIQHAQAFTDYVQSLRRARALRNDDVTLLSLQFRESL